MPTAPHSDAAPVPGDAPDRTERLARLAAQTAYDSRAEEIAILDVAELCSYADYFVLVTGRNRTQLRAIAHRVEGAMEQSGAPRLGREGLDDGQWILEDFGDVVLQAFEPDAREFYQLEELWADAPRLAWTPRQMEGGADASAAEPDED